jgi:hypothetical protein
MKKIAYLIGAALMIAGMFASCSLDSMSLTEKDTTNFPKTAEDANQALAAIYQNLNNVNAFPQQSFLYNSLLACDDMLGGGGPNDKLNLWTLFVIRVQMLRRITGWLAIKESTVPIRCWRLLLVLKWIRK